MIDTETQNRNLFWVFSAKIGISIHLNKVMNESQFDEIIDTLLKGVYKDAGGIFDDYDNLAFESIKNHLKESNKIKIENGEPVFVKNGQVELGNDGKPKTAIEKMYELKSISPFNFYFTNTHQAINSNPKNRSRHDAQLGKISMDDIVSGKIVISDKGINQSEIEKTPSRKDFHNPTKIIDTSKLIKGER